jgi:rod shape-determining protein MreD
LTPGLRHRIERAACGLAPLVLTLALVLFGVLPWPLPEFAPVTPWFSLIAVYYWSIHRPDLLPPSATFLVGLVQDGLSGSPLGLNVLLLLLAQGVVATQRRFFHGKTFLIEWWGFMLVAPGVALTGWLLGSLYHGALMAPLPIGFQLLLTIASYPCLAWLLARAQHYLLRPA